MRQFSQVKIFLTLFWNVSIFVVYHFICHMHTNHGRQEWHDWQIHFTTSRNTAIESHKIGVAQIRWVWEILLVKSYICFPFPSQWLHKGYCIQFNKVYLLLNVILNLTQHKNARGCFNDNHVKYEDICSMRSEMV